MTSPYPRVSADNLIAFATNVLTAVGVPGDDARLVADSLVQAELWGHPSHGVLRLGWYVDRLRAGVMRPVTTPELVVDANAIAVIDGHDGVGQVIMAGATRLAIARAKAHGVGVVGVRNSNHFGTAMYFSRMAPPEGCIALLSTNASPAMAPWGGTRKAVGNNPWSISAPAGRYGRMTLDIANTAVARGKIYLARQKGESIPATWAQDSEGRPTTDPVDAIAGIILPIGGHKGYGISLMMDVLSGVLTGSAFGSAVHGPYQAEKRGGTGHFVLALNVEAFMPLAEFTGRMEELVAGIKAVPAAPGIEEIYFPGEIEQNNEVRIRREGIDLPDQTLLDLAKLGKDSGVAMPELLPVGE